MVKNNWLIPSLIVIGLVSVGLSLLIASQTEKQKPGSRPLARLELNLGKVFVLRKNMTPKRNSHSPCNFISLWIQWKPALMGMRQWSLTLPIAFACKKNSLITLDEESDRIVVIIKRGDVQVENYGREGSVLSLAMACAGMPPIMK